MQFLYSSEGLEVETMLVVLQMSSTNIMYASNKK